MVPCRRLTCRGRSALTPIQQVGARFRKQRGHRSALPGACEGVQPHLRAWLVGGFCGRSRISCRASTPWRDPTR